MAFNLKSLHASSLLSKSSIYQDKTVCVYSNTVGSRSRSKEQQTNSSFDEVVNFNVGISFCPTGDKWQYRSLNLVFPCLNLWVITLSLLLLKMEKKNIFLKRSFANSMFLIGKSSRLSWVYHPVKKYGKEFDQICNADFARIINNQRTPSWYLNWIPCCYKVQWPDFQRRGSLTRKCWSKTNVDGGYESHGLHIQEIGHQSEDNFNQLASHWTAVSELCLSCNNGEASLWTWLHTMKLSSVESVSKVSWAVAKFSLF